MATNSLLIKISLSIFLVLSGIFTFAQTAHKWEVTPIVFQSKKQMNNPYAEIPAIQAGDLLEVHFTGIDGEAKGHRIKLIGFWNGGKEWRVNFAAPYSGTWEYKSFSSDRGLNGKTGKIQVTDWSEDELQSNPSRRGVIRVSQSGESAGHFFEYADGYPFLWIGDTWWNWTKRSIHFDTFKKMVDNRAEKGFNLGQLFVPGNGWGRESSILDETYSELDTEHMKKVEQMVAYANAKGITVWVHAWWSRPELNRTVGAEKMQRWWRYLVHRLGAYNVIWILGGEYNMHNNAGFDLDFWKDLGKLVKKEDPYKRIISLHNTPPFWDGGAEAPQWSTGEVFHDETWLDYNQCQSGHGKYANEMIPVVIANEYKRQPAKPIVITEPWYEFIEGNPTGMDIRLAAWGAILSGAAGHTYGGGHVWLASVPESPAGGGGAWPIEVGAEIPSFDYEGAVSMQHLASFFKQIEWWKMTPRPDLVKDSPQPFCLAVPGKEYIVYLRYGGMLNLNIGQSSEEKSFSYYWYNPKTGEATTPRQIKGKNFLQFTAPGMYPGAPHYSDRVLHVYEE
ncbi:MAG: DUF4038 domain-containing protein [Mariniphaga sp.]|nr:DUF4038 domain-containing protein [Mariniphaga sp.]MDD4224757.1 DUF4038 domain-containing protein [Mariniphaga sp.]